MLPSAPLHWQITEQIISAYYAVYNKLSHTYPEFIFERAMLALLQERGLSCVHQDEYEIKYKDQLVGVQRLDIFVAHEVVVELKVALALTSLHLAQLISYLKTVGKPVGLLFRFGGPNPQFERRILTEQNKRNSLSNSAIQLRAEEDWLHPELMIELMRGLADVFGILGPGFIHRIYANACYQEMKLRGLEVKAHQEFRVFMDKLDLGAIKFGHLQIDQRALVFPVAVSDLKSIYIMNLKAWMRYLNVSMGILLNFQATRFEPIVLRV